MESKIRKIVLLNALEHDGRAESGSVLGKLIADDAEVKKKIKETIPHVKKIIEEINSMSKEDQNHLAKKLGVKIVKEKKVEKNELPELPNVKKVVTAFPPEPSKYPHLGHAKSALVNFLYAKKYKGKFILRFEDSNPTIARKEYYDAILDGMKWLGLEWDKLDYLSDHMDDYYKAIAKLLRNGDAYVCFCEQDEIKKNRMEGEECKCRSADEKENIKYWKKMLEDMKVGEAIVRMKIDVKHVNSALRDPTIARIIDKSHVRTKKKYRVWPNYDLGTSMLDGWEKVTHRVRTKEFEMRKELQDIILKKLGLESPFIMEIGRFQIKDAITRGREIREGIEREVFTGWDDPRLATLAALRRRGFDPEALKEFLLSTGVTKAESVYEWQVIEAFNKKHIDPISDRYFAVLDPVKIKIEGLTTGEVSVNMKPGDKKTRKIPVKSDSVYIEKGDEDNLKDRKVGLMFLCLANFGSVKRFVSRKIPQEDPKIHWVAEENMKIKIVMPDGRTVSGIGELGMEKLEVGQMIQLYRIGFCRVDKSGKDLVLYFAHK